MVRKIYDEKSRIPIRQALKDHMGDDISARQLADVIRDRSDRYQPSISATTIGRFLDDRPQSKKVGHDCVATLELYLRDEGVLKAAALNAKHPAPAHPAVFPALCHLFRMDDTEAAPYRDAIKGDWAFYAYSERGKARVCRGAIRFSIQPDGSYCAHELQESTPAGGGKLYRELYDGHFLLQRNVLIAVLMNKTRPLPKFYILSVESHENDAREKEVMTGWLLKAGEHKHVFSTSIYIVRRATAFDECTMLPRTEVDAEILASLDGSEWLSAEVRQPLSQFPGRLD